MAARPPSTAYRLGKFLRRHRAAAVAVGIVSVTTVVFGIAMAIQAARVASERDRAKAEAEKSAAVSEYLLNLFQPASPVAESFSEEEVEAAALVLQRVVAELDRLEDQPEAREEILEGAGWVLFHRGAFDQAGEVFGLVLRSRAARVSEPDALVVSARLGLGGIAHERGDYEAAEAEFGACIEAADRLPAAPSLRSAARRWLGDLRREQARLDEAEALLREAIEIYRTEVAQDDLEYVSMLTSLSHVLRQRGDVEPALALLQEGQGVLIEVFGTRRHGDVATNLNNQAGLLANLNRPEEAERMYREALELRSEVSGADDVHTSYVYNNLGVFLTHQGKADEACDLLAKAHDIAREQLGPSPTTAIFQANFGRACLAAGNSRAAEEELRGAIALYSEKVGAGHPRLARMRSDLGGALAAEERWEAAATELLAAGPLLEKHYGSDSPYVVVNSERIATVIVGSGRSDLFPDGAAPAE